MARFLKTSLILIVFLFMAFMGGGPQALADQSKVVLVGGGQAYKPLDDFVLESESPTIAGDSWYVDSGKTASGDGKSWDYAVITADEANNLASADNGDVIHVAPGHAETIDAATDWVCDKAGIKYVGYGEGRQRPTFSWADAAAATIPVSAADVKFYNMVFDGTSTSADGPNAMFTITAAGFQLIGSEIIIADSIEAATLVISGSAAANRMKVIGNRFYGTTDTGATAAISFGTALVNDIEIGYNTFEGDFSSAAIYATTPITQVNIHHNYIFNYQDDDHAIEISSNTSTGVIAYNHVVTDAYITAIDSGGLDVIETYWSNDEADDVMAVQVWTHEDGATPWSATELLALEAEVEDEMQDQNLDQLLAVTAGALAYPTDVLDDAILGHIMATDLITSYVRTTDSLEAIGTQVADAQQQTNITAMIEADFLDELIIDAVATDLGTSVDDDSVMGYVLAITNVTSYSRATDSLEAIGTEVSTTTQRANITAMIEADFLDELIIAPVAIDISTSVDDDAVMGFVMATLYVSSYDRTTDSLEALGTNVAAGTGVTVALEADFLDELIIAPVAIDISTSVDDDSVMGYVMATLYVSSYDRTTDSLEAIGTDVVAIEVDTTAIEIDTTAIEVDTKDLQDMGERSVKRTTASLPATATATIFTVSTGPVEILSFVGYVTTEIQAQACTIHVSGNPTTGAYSTLAGGLDINGDDTGTVYSLTTSLATAIAEGANGIIASMGNSFNFVMPEGVIQLGTTATNTGEIEWYIRWRPLVTGATITAS